MSIKDTNSSIKYILEEMDPAEKVEFEREMACNPDLKIEVESIRRMKSKLNSLPSFHPPKHISESILSVAADQTSKKQGIKSGYYLSAAVVILGLTTGALILQNSTEELFPAGNSSASISIGNEISQTGETRTSDIQPWVDRQDVLRISGFESISNSIQLREIGNSYEKLKPVGNYPGIQPFRRSVQLTGSNQ